MKICHTNLFVDDNNDTTLSLEVPGVTRLCKKKKNKNKNRQLMLVLKMLYTVYLGLGSVIPVESR